MTFSNAQEGDEEIMKRGFFALLFLIIFSPAGTPSHALLGTNDNVVGYDILVPFFLVSMSGHGNLDTLIAITETDQASATSVFHYTVYTKSSATLYDDNVSLTVGDVTTLSASTIVGNMSAGVKAQLQYDLDGDGTDDHYVGFMIFENPNTATPINHIMASAYLVDFQNGISAGMNLPVREVNESKNMTDGNIINLTRFTEYFSANALYRAQRLIAGQGVANPTHFRLTPRIYIQDASSHNYYFIWASNDCPTTTLHINFWDTTEQTVSANFPLHAGLNILNIEPYLPFALFPSTTYPKEGWIDMDITLGTISGSVEMLGYSFQTKTVPPGICGDVSNEGSVNISDAMFIAQFLAGNRSCICSGTAREQCNPSSQSPTGIGFISLTEMSRDAY